MEKWLKFGLDKKVIVFLGLYFLSFSVMARVSGGFYYGQDYGNKSPELVSNNEVSILDEIIEGRVYGGHSDEDDLLNERVQENQVIGVNASLKNSVFGGRINKKSDGVVESLFGEASNNSVVLEGTRVGAGVDGGEVILENKGNGDTVASASDNTVALSSVCSTQEKKFIYGGFADASKGDSAIAKAAFNVVKVADQSKILHKITGGILIVRRDMLQLQHRQITTL